MKFNFKIQQYQTDAVDAVVKVFRGQGFQDKLSYIRDLGKHEKPSNVQLTLDGNSKEEMYDDDTGYKNETIELTDEQILKNIHKLQTENNIKLSSSLIKNLGRCSLDIEMETGERVIIVMGALNVILSRVSRTLTKYYSYIA